jgi:gas vesicle protein
MTEVRLLLGVLGVLLLVGFAAGCGLVSDQTKQEAKKKVEAKSQQVKQEAKKKVESKGQQVRQEVKKKMEAGQEDLKKKVDELLKKVDAQEQQDLKK